MDDRLHRALDRELPCDELSADEQAELAALQALFSGVVRSVPVDPLPDLSRSVLRRLEPTPVQSSRARELFNWLWRPRPLSIGWRPAYGLAAAALIAVIMGGQALQRDA